MELIVQLLVEVFASVLSVTLGMAIAAVAYWLWVTARRRLWGLDQATVVETPAGDRYTLEIPKLQVRTPVSRRLFRSRDARTTEQPKWDESDALHPARLLDKADEALILVVPFVLLVVVAFAVIFAIEFIIAVLLMGLASMTATIVRHRWKCVVTRPDGTVVEVRARGLRRVRRLRNELADEIARGDLSGLLQPY